MRTLSEAGFIVGVMRRIIDIFTKHKRSAVLRRIIFTTIAISILILAAMGLESLMLGSEGMLLRDSITAPVMRLMETPRHSDTHLVVAVDEKIGGILGNEIINKSLREIEEKIQGEGKTMLVKYLSAADLQNAKNRGELDLMITDADVYAMLAYEGKTKALASLIPPQATSADYSVSSTIVTRRDNDRIFTLEDLATYSPSMMVKSERTFGAMRITEDALIKERIDTKQAFKNLTIATTHHSAEVLRAVRDGTVEVGMVPACTIELLMKKNQAHLSDYRVIHPQSTAHLKCQHSAAEYPSYVISYYSDIDASNLWEMSTILYGMDLVGGYRWTVPANFRALYDLMYRLKMGPYGAHHNVSFVTFYSQHKMLFVTATFLVVAALFYNLIVSIEVAQRTVALKRAMRDKDRYAQLQEKSNEYISRLERVGIVGQMSSMIAHELKQPLASVNNYAGGLLRRLERGTLDEATLKKILQEIYYHNDRAVQIVDHVRGYVKQPEVKREFVDIREIAEKTVSTFERSGRSQVPVHIEGESCAYIEADGWELELALFNLIKNSSDAYADEHPAMHASHEAIRIVIEDHETSWWIRVYDTAKLVKPEVTEQFFKQFKSTKQFGLGLGLGIVNSLAERQGGRVWATPNVPRGVCVNMEIPKIKPEVLDAMIQKQLKESGSSAILDKMHARDQAREMENKWLDADIVD